ncbi:hypothetical protein UFOVP344_47 [uncultured Caudovirales phage]|uniref:Deoxynucleoside monophosphate kinase n=1 Tax=uncultured Caudovirales phage TaxID=2100421 RepID=A0A6J5LWB4_9CAUD|nr:hypothetical protein UFOVP344_47 [uncultured Caudovirales phage]
MEKQLELPLNYPDAPRLLGIVAPRMRSGKSEVAYHLLAEHDYDGYHMAGVLKEMIYALVCALRPWYLHTDPWEYVYGIHKETPIAEFGGKSARELMQTLGTDWGRNMVDENIWVTVAASDIKSMLKDQQSVVIDDIRFPNEVEMIKSLGGQIIYVDRPVNADTWKLEDAVLSHESEGRIRREDCDFYLLNDGTLEELRAKIDTIVNTPQ